MQVGNIPQAECIIIPPVDSSGVILFWLKHNYGGHRIFTTTYTISAYHH